MPMAALARAIDPPPRQRWWRPARTSITGLPDRGPGPSPRRPGSPTNWIYIHATDVKVGRIQNFGSWSPFMVKDGRTCLGMEYFVFEGRTVDQFRRRAGWRGATAEIQSLGSCRRRCRDGLRGPGSQGLSVLRHEYRANVATIAAYLDGNAPTCTLSPQRHAQVQQQDHSMYTAMLTVENIHGASHDIWACERGGGVPRGGGQSRRDDHRTGRDAPILPRRTSVTTPESATAPAPTAPAPGTQKDDRPE